MPKGDLPPRPLANGEPQALLKACRTWRERAMVVLLWRCGLRVSEACELRVTDCEFLQTGGAIIHVRFGKGRRARFVGLDKRAADLLAAGMPRAGFVLATTTGGRLHTSEGRRKLPVLAKRAGIAGRVHPHGLRHTFARNMHDEGFSVVKIQLALGHEDLGVTQDYLQSLGCADVVEEATQREW